MLKDWMATGLKLRMRGYRSMGDSVPLVMMTDWYLPNTGRMASEASRQESWMTGSGMSGRRSSWGSMMIAKPCGVWRDGWLAGWLAAWE
jgi:hypothetical protein